MNNGVTLVIADHDRFMVEALVSVLGGQSDFEIVDTATDAEGAAAAMEDRRPTVAILDVDLAFDNGENLVSRLRKLSLSAGIVFIGDRMDPNAGRRTDAAMRAAGLEIQSTEGATAITYGGDYRARYRKLTMEIARPMAIASGSWSETSLQALLDLFDDPTFGYVDNLWIGIVGRKPLE